MGRTSNDSATQLAIWSMLAEHEGTVIITQRGVSVINTSTATAQLLIEKATSIIASQEEKDDNYFSSSQKIVYFSRDK